MLQMPAEFHLQGWNFLLNIYDNGMTTSSTYNLLQPAQKRFLVSIVLRRQDMDVNKLSNVRRVIRRGSKAEMTTVAVREQSIDCQTPRRRACSVDAGTDSK
jgi:hypothetical protein